MCHATTRNVNISSNASSGASGYRIVRLSSGVYSVHSLAHAETFHPVIGPVAEAEALYVRQLDLVERLRRHSGEFVVWDVGLGAAANALTLVRALREVPCKIRLISFDHTLEPLGFALAHSEHLPYLSGYEPKLTNLLDTLQTDFPDGNCSLQWSVQLADFPSLLRTPEAAALPKPHLVMFDAFSPAKNPAMWTLPLFSDLFRLLDPNRSCALPTYSRSTMLRVTLLLAGFFVGVGHATGQKEETTVAANSLELIQAPLDLRWLSRAHRSRSAEPMFEPIYRQTPLSKHTRERLQAHPQFL